MLTSPNSKEFEDQAWDEYNDICAIKTFNRTNNAIGEVSENQIQINKRECLQCVRSTRRVWSVACTVRVKTLF